MHISSSSEIESFVGLKIFTFIHTLKNIWYKNVTEITELNPSLKLELELKTEVKLQGGTGGTHYNPLTPNSESNQM